MLQEEVSSLSQQITTYQDELKITHADNKLTDNKLSALQKEYQLCFSDKIKLSQQVRTYLSFVFGGLKKFHTSFVVVLLLISMAIKQTFFI